MARGRIDRRGFSTDNLNEDKDEKNLACACSVPCRVRRRIQQPATWRGTGYRTWPAVDHPAASASSASSGQYQRKDALKTHFDPLEKGGNVVWPGSFWPWKSVSQSSFARTPFPWCDLFLSVVEYPFPAFYHWLCHDPASGRKCPSMVKKSAL